MRDAGSYQCAPLKFPRGFAVTIQLAKSGAVRKFHLGFIFCGAKKKKRRLMPVAGPLAEGRAHAHYRWAERYNDNGDHEKAAAHFGRALDYSDEASFGVAKLTRGKQSTKPWSGVKQAGIKKPEGVRKRDPVKTPDHRPR